MNNECFIQFGHLTLETASTIKKIELLDILYFQVKCEYTCIMLVTGKELLTNDALKSLIEELPNYFYRINKSVIVNMNYCEYRRILGEQSIVIMKDGVQFTISRRRHSSFKDCLKRF